MEYIKLENLKDFSKIREYPHRGDIVAITLNSEDYFNCEEASLSELRRFFQELWLNNDLEFSIILSESGAKVIKEFFVSSIGYAVDPDEVLEQISHIEFLPYREEVSSEVSELNFFLERS